MTGLALISGARLAQGPRNQVRAGGRTSGPPETRLMPYTGHRHWKGTHLPPSVYNAPGDFPVIINQPTSRVRLPVKSTFNRKVLPGYTITANAAKAQPVYIRPTHVGSVHNDDRLLVGFKPGITPEHARLLESRGYTFSNRNLREKVKGGELVNPNTSLLNSQRQHELRARLSEGKTGLNAYPGWLRSQIGKLARRYTGFSAIVPGNRKALLPK